MHGTFEEDTNDPVKIKGALDMFSESVHRSLLKQWLLFKAVTQIICFEDFSTYIRSKIAPIWTADIFIIIKTVLQLLSEFIYKGVYRFMSSPT